MPPYRQRQVEGVAAGLAHSAAPASLEPNQASLSACYRRVPVGPHYHKSTTTPIDDYGGEREMGHLAPVAAAAAALHALAAASVLPAAAGWEAQAVRQHSEHCALTSSYYSTIRIVRPPASSLLLQAPGLLVLHRAPGESGERTPDGEKYGVRTYQHSRKQYTTPFSGLKQTWKMDVLIINTVACPEHIFCVCACARA